MRANITAWLNIWKYCQEFKIQELCPSEIIVLFLRKKKRLCLDFFEQPETSILQGFSNLFRNSDTKNETLPEYPVRI